MFSVPSVGVAHDLIEVVAELLIQILFLLGNSGDTSGSDLVKLFFRHVLQNRLVLFQEFVGLDLAVVSGFLVTLNAENEVSDVDVFPHEGKDGVPKLLVCPQLFEVLVFEPGCQPVCESEGLESLPDLEYLYIAGIVFLGDLDIFLN